MKVPRSGQSKAPGGDPVREECVGEVRRVLLGGGRGNALDARRLAALARAFDPRERDPGPVVLAAEGRSFCTGLDLVGSFDLDREGMRELMRRFHEALTAVALWPGHVVAALQGHALAGGALLALCAGERIMAHGDARFGIHGVHIGVVYPQVAIEVLRWRLGRAVTEDLLYRGELHGGVRALERGLVDELVDAGSLAGRAVERARSRVHLPGHEALTAPLRSRLEAIDPRGEESWLDHWFAPPTRRRVGAARREILERSRSRGSRD